MDTPRGVFSVVFESSQVNDDCTILPSNHKRTCGKNGWSHLLSSHRFMLSVFEDRSVFTGQNGMLVGWSLSLSVFSQEKKNMFIFWQDVIDPNTFQFGDSFFHS